MEEKKSLTYDRKFVESLFKNSLDNQFNQVIPYIELKSEQFAELNTKVFEICKCLMTESFTASITMTNHVLERLLKLALIINECGIGPIDGELWNKKYEEPHKNYSDKKLAFTIDHCLKNGLITAEEKTYLYDKVRDQLRNGFSHSDTDKILIENEEFTTMYQFSFKNPSEGKPIKMNLKTIPILQSVQMDNFARDNAFQYFKNIFILIKNIEHRLKVKHGAK